MKKLTLLTITAFLAITALGQTNTFPGSGNVGIGTTSPDNILHIQYTNNTTSGTGAGQFNSGLQIENLSTTTNSYSQIQLRSNTGDIYLRNTYSGTSNRSRFGILTDNDNNVIEAISVTYNGNVGIGTTTPNAPLTISNSTPAIQFNDTDGGDWDIYSYANKLLFREGLFGSSPTSRLVIVQGGNIGIGTTDPSAKLETYLTSSGKALALLGENKDIEFHMGHAAGTSYGFYWKYVGTGSGNLNDLELWSQNMSGDDKLIYQVHQDGNIKFEQKVGIGCEGATNDYQLAVNGTIGCGEVKVVDVSGWADFVFEDGYNLMPLDELETYIEENNHLPEIPTTREVEENGISVGGMNAKLLQKIEELTLYMIEMKKENDELKSRIEQLETSNQ